MLFLPEASDYIVEDSGTMAQMAEPLDGPTVNKYKEIACQNNLWLSVGIHEKEKVFILNNKLKILYFIL